MSQSEKAELYNELKDAGVQFTKHYRDYNTKELGEAVAKLRAAQPASDSPPPEPEPQFDPAATAAAYAAMAQPEPPPVASAPPPAPENPRSAPEVQPSIPVAHANPDELPGQRQNTSQLEMEPIRTDPETGFIWFQEEVRKPAYPKPRGRRVLKYMETGIKTETVKNGDYIESFEVAGEGQARPAEVKITLPSYQVGIYKDPRFPFKVYVYNGRQGFDLFEVQNFYGGSELVPAEIKRVYVENVLCYDIRTTVRAIQTEYRQQQLARRVQ